ncbi:hypothetical protein OAG24_00710 [bacterium]|nr:hypothetical protein [bacterium]
MSGFGIEKFDAEAKILRLVSLQGDVIEYTCSYGIFNCTAKAAPTKRISIGNMSQDVPRDTRFLLEDIFSEKIKAEDHIEQLVKSSPYKIILNMRS